MDQLIGKKLDGRYELQELIGSGGMAQVYRAVDLTTGRSVAVKVLKDQFLDNEEIVQRFRNESRAISMLDHPNIVKVFDVSVWDKTQFLVMELVEGQDLRHFMETNGGKLTWKEAVKYTEETLHALQHAHEHGIVHRDIKPQNIMLMEDGSIKVMDFGIARFSRSGVHTTTDKAMGSVHYISPEQARGEVTDAKSDIYSVGVMMYEMLTGQLPFDGESNVAVAIKQISEDPKPLLQIDPTIPEMLESIVLRAMEKDPDKRYVSAQDMLDDLSRFKENPSIMFAYQYMHDTPTRYIDTVKEVEPKSSTPAATAKKKKKKGLGHYILPVLIGMAFAFMVGSAILVYMIFSFSGNTLFEKREDVNLPNFVGMSVEDILGNREYTDQFRFTVKETYRADYAVGEIYDQSPKGNKTVKEGHEVILRVSKGVQIVTVPDVTDYTKAEAEATLRALDLSVLVRYETNDAVPLGQVIKTEPAANTQLSSGQQVTVFVSAEKVDNTRKVPNLIGLASLEDAQKLLNQNSLVLGTATGVENESPAGTILDQSVPADTSVYSGSSINVSYSTGFITRNFLVKVEITAEGGGIILNGQEVTYPGGSYVTEGGKQKQTFTFTVSTTSTREVINVNGEEYVIEGDTEIFLTVEQALRPAGCTCPEGTDHDSVNFGCSLLRDPRCTCELGKPHNPENAECLLNKHTGGGSGESESGGQNPPPDSGSTGDSGSVPPVESTPPADSSTGSESTGE